MKKSTWHLTSVILTVVCGDGIIKKLAEKKLAEQPPKRVCGGKIILNLLHNHGAALGVLSREPRLLLVVNSVSAWIDRTEAKLYHLTHLQADAGKGAAQ